MVRRFATGLLLFALVCGCSEQGVVDLPALEGRARSGDERASRELVALLGHTEQGVNDKAYAILMGLGTRAVPSLLESVDSPDRIRREYVIAGLGTLQVRAAVPAIARVLEEKQLQRRYIAAWALGEIGDPDGVPPLLAALDDDNDEVRRYATRSLIKLNQAAVEPLIAFLLKAPPESSGAAAAVRALGDIGDPRALEVLLAAAGGPHRADAFHALGKLKEPRAESVLIAGLSDPDWQNRMHAAMALGPVGSASSEAPLRQALDDEVVFVREWAARSLEMVSGERVLYRNLQGELAPPYNVYH